MRCSSGRTLSDLPRKKAGEKFSSFVDRMLAMMDDYRAERLLTTYFLASREEKRHRLKTVQVLSVELHEIQKVSLFATRLGECIIEDVIVGDWKSVAVQASTFFDGEDESIRDRYDLLWEKFLLVARVAAEEAGRLAEGVRPEGN